jgi:non-ribosomal peptide synthetase component F
MTLAEKMCEELRVGGLSDTYVAEGAPDTKDDALSLTPYMGSPVDIDQGIIGDEQNVQCHVRGKTYISGYALAWEAYGALLAKFGAQAAYDGYRIVEFMQSPTYLGRDEKGRRLFSFNMRLKKIFT